MSPEIQAVVAELEEQRNVLGSRAAKLAGQLALYKRRVEELEEKVATLRADIASRDSTRTAEDS